MLQSFTTEFHRSWLDGMRSKLGLFTEEQSDAALVETLLAWMHQHRRDFTHTFRALSVGTMDGAGDGGREEPEILAWRREWKARLDRQPQALPEVRERMRRHNPAVIPRNHRVEEALEAASSLGDLGPLQELLAVLAEPYDSAADGSVHASPPPPSERVYQTFCGT